MMAVGELPKGWCASSFADILTPLADGRLLHHGWSPQCHKQPSDSELTWGVLKTTAIQPGSFLSEHNKQLPSKLSPRPQLEVTEGDLLLTCAGPRARCGIPCLVRSTRRRLIISGKMYRFRAASGIDPRYVEAFLLRPETQKAIDEIKTGISDSGLNLTHSRFLELTILVAPLVEQRGIVAKIEALFSELDKGVEQLQAVRQQLKRYRQSVLKAAFEGKLTAAWRAEQAKAGKHPSADDLLSQIRAERAACYQQQLADWQETLKRWGGTDCLGRKPGKPIKPNDLPPVAADELANLPEIPKGWTWIHLGELALPNRPITYGVIKLGKDVDGGVPILRSSNVRHLCLEIDHVKRIEHSIAASYARTFLAGGEVLITVRGTLGGVAVVPPECKGFNVSREVAPIAPISSLSPHYLQYVIGSWYVEQWMKPRLRGIAYTGINIETLKTVPIMVCSAPEQQQIVQEIESRFSVLDELEKAVEAGLTQAEALRQSILKTVFEGRLLSQAELVALHADPAYEPADALLERIRKETAVAGTGPVSGRRGRKTKLADRPQVVVKLPPGERYRQAAFAAYAVNRLADRPTFGRVQQMKYLYLVPHVLAQESHIHARREAAGPLDPAIHKIEGLAQRNGWFTVKKAGQRYVYERGAAIAKACTFAKEKFGDKATRVDWLLDQFARMDTEQAELLATAFAVWNDHLIDGHEPTDAEIVNGIHGWHPDKAAKFPPERIRECVAWMKKHDLVPTGTGPRTISE